MTTFDSLPEALVLARKRSGFSTQAAAAKAVGFTQQQLSKYESGKIPPSLANLGRLLDAYRLSLPEFGEILGEVQNRPSPLDQRFSVFMGEVGAEVNRLRAEFQATASALERRLIQLESRLSLRATPQDLGLAERVKSSSGSTGELVEHPSMPEIDWEGEIEAFAKKWGHEEALPAIRELLKQDAPRKKSRRAKSGGPPKRSK